MKLLVVLVFLAVCQAYIEHGEQKKHDWEDDHYYETPKTAKYYLYGACSNLGKKIHSVIGKGTYIVHHVVTSLYKKLTPLLHGHLHTLCHDADHFKHDVKYDLHSYTHDDGNELAEDISCKVDEVKKIAAHHIKLVDIKGLKVRLLYKIGVLKVHVIKGLKHLKAKRIPYIKLLKLKLLKALGAFKRKLLSLTHKIDYDVVQKIKETEPEKHKINKYAEIVKHFLAHAKYTREHP